MDSFRNALTQPPDVLGAWFDDNERLTPSPHQTPIRSFATPPIQKEESKDDESLHCSPTLILPDGWHTMPDESLSRYGVAVDEVGSSPSHHGSTSSLSEATQGSQQYSPKSEAGDGGSQALLSSTEFRTTVDGTPVEDSIHPDTVGVLKHHHLIVDGVSRYYLVWIPFVHWRQVEDGSASFEQVAFQTENPRVLLYGHKQHLGDRSRSKSLGTQVPLTDTQTPLFEAAGIVAFNGAFAQLTRRFLDTLVPEGAVVYEEVLILAHELEVYYNSTADSELHRIILQQVSRRQDLISRSGTKDSQPTAYQSSMGHGPTPFAKTSMPMQLHGQHIQVISATLHSLDQSSQTTLARHHISQTHHRSLSGRDFRPMQVLMSPLPALPFQEASQLPKISSPLNDSRFSNQYCGRHIDENASAHWLSDQQNCSLWIRNLPADVSCKELLLLIRKIGRIWCVVINRADGRFHHTSAAKITLYTAEAAQKFLKCVEAERPQIRGFDVIAGHNRVKAAARPLDHTSRVLIITGKSSIVNSQYLTTWFGGKFIFETDEVIELGRQGDRVVLEFRFGSHRCQAAMGMTLIRRERPDGIEMVEYALDPCEYGDEVVRVQASEVARQRLGRLSLPS